MYKFPLGVRLAIQFVLGLTRHDWMNRHLGLTQANWCNFDFFNKILASRIERGDRVEPTADHPGYWKESRSVDFHVLGHLVATVYITGHRYDRGTFFPKHSGSCWTVYRIRYARQFDDPSGPSDWTDCEWEPAGMILDWDDFLEPTPCPAC